MKIIHRKKIEETEINVYVADDGHQFDTEEECITYEKERSELYKRIEALRVQTADGYAPCDGLEHTDNNEYVWYMVNTPEDLHAIEKFYSLNSYESIKGTSLPNKICIETQQNYDYNYSYTERDCIRYVKDLFDKLDKKVIFEPIEKITAV